jgi:DNA-binding NarL/FixJ family response regulator
MEMASATSAGKTRVLVVDDHPIVRNGLLRLIGHQLDFACCGEAGDASEAQQATSALKPELVIMDLRLKNGDGLELIKSMLASQPELKIIVLSQYCAPIHVQRALRAGALGYVAKEHAADEILNAMRTVRKGEFYLARGMATLLLGKTSGDNPRPTGLEQLTDRELHVLELLGSGLGTREIATELQVSFKTIETHRENIKHKLGLRGASELLHLANQCAREHIALPPEALSQMEAVFLAAG